MKPHPLLDTIKEMMSIKSDAKIGKLLGIASPVISKIRNRRLEVGATFILVVHDTCGMEIKNIKVLIESSKEAA